MNHKQMAAEMVATIRAKSNAPLEVKRWVSPNDNRWWVCVECFEPSKSLSRTVQYSVPRQFSTDEAEAVSIEKELKAYV